MTQRERLLRALRHGPVNTTDFLAPRIIDAGAPITRVAARIFDLQQAGYGIRTERRINGTTTYTLTRDVELGDATAAENPSSSGACPTVIAELGAPPTSSRGIAPAPTDVLAAPLFDDDGRPSMFDVA